MRTFRSIIEELAWRHCDIGNTASRHHFCMMGDESSVKSDTILQYPCIMYNEEPDGYYDNRQYLFRRSQVTLLFLDHVEDTGDFSGVENTVMHMQRIAEDFIRGIYAMTRAEPDILFERSTMKIERVENVDACLYGKALTLTFVEPFDLCLDDDSPFIAEGIFEESLTVI